MKRLLPVFICSLLVSTAGIAQNNLTQAANRFLSSLNNQQKQKTAYTFTDDERYNWHFVPKSRKGIPLNDLNAQQKEAAYALLKLCMSESGYKRATDIIQLETVLKVIENRDDNFRDPGNYYLTFFGTPTENKIWGWRIEGHHLSMNFSSQNNKLVAGTPGFMGANPAVVPSGPQKGKQTLKEETEQGFALVNSLNADQLTKALFNNNAPNDIITFADRTAMIKNPQGIKYNELTKEQQAQLVQLVDVYIHRYTKLFADDMWATVKAAGLDKLQFAWAGSKQPGTGKGWYYRIQGPTFIIEYDNTQNSANHVHSVLRDLKNDFGGDELLEHYKKEHN